jgi:hypothetical protein
MMPMALSGSATWWTPSLIAWLVGWSPVARGA